MSFLQPIWLWGLLSLSLPLAIHLFSRKPPKSHPVGSLKPFMHRQSRNPKKLSIDRFWLMLLRMAILAAFFCWLAEPVWEHDQKKEKKQLVLLHPDTPEDKQRSFITDEGYDVRWLQAGLPKLADSVRINEPMDLWELLALADGLQGIKDSIWVVSALVQKNFGQQRPALTHAVLWLPFEEKLPTALADHTAYQLTVDTSLQYWQEANKGENKPTDNLEVVIAYAPKYEQDKQLLIWALSAASLGSPHVYLQIKEQPLPADKLPDGKLVWLADEAPKQPAWIILKPQPGSGWLMETDREVWLNKRPADYRQEPAILSLLPLALSKILPELPASVQLAVSENEAHPLITEELTADIASLQPLENLFLFLFLTLLILERWWVYRSA